MSRTCLFTGFLGVLLIGCGGGAEDTRDSQGVGSGIEPSVTLSGTQGQTSGSPTESSDGSGSTGGETTSTSGMQTTNGGSGIKFDIGDSETGGGSSTDTEGDCGPAKDATLQGKVFAPNLELPISGALVYVTSDPVDPVPDGVYCAECVQLDCSTPYTFSEADGSFTLPATSGQNLQLVVQKGQFLRVVNLNITPGMNAIPATQSNLPGEWNPAAGMWIPRIAVYQTNPDAVYNVLAKFGLAQVSGSGVMVPGTEQFTLISDSDQGAFMDDLAGMNQYHIVFVPCASTKYWFGAPGIAAQRINNIQSYVAAGGKWYATDHSNEYIEGPFPDYQEFHNPGMPDIQPAYTSNGTVVDTELLAWLQALPDNLKDIGGGFPNLYQLPTVTTEDNFSGIDIVNDVWVEDMMGEQVNVGHHTWVEGPCQSCSNPQQTRPMAVSGQYGCGRMMYSTFETSSTAHNGLSPQELVLLYMILEITTCFDETPPPPPN